VRRIVKGILKEGDEGVVHKLRGKEGNRKIGVSFKKKVLDLYRKSYWDFGPVLASEKLLERDGIKVCDETLRLWLIKEGLWQLSKRAKPKDRTRRERREYFGQMTQMDGSNHDWLEGRGPRLVLMGYIDDATNRFHGEFYDYEGTMPAMGGLKGYIKRYGLPGSLYLDKHSTYKNNHKQRYTDWPFKDEEALTQFSRACKQLGIEVIFAHSPQAKGRIERVFKTLQDRLVKELRLGQIDNLQDANRLLKAFLPIFNKKFEVSARGSSDFHRPVDQRLNLDDILAIQTVCFLRNDRTAVHNKQWYQILTKTRAQQITLHEHLDGHVGIRHGKTKLAFKPIETPAPKVYQPVVPRFRVRGTRKAPKNSGFRMFRLAGSPSSKTGHF
jgi:hypothetical protein